MALDPTIVFNATHAPPFNQELKITAAIMEVERIAEEAAHADATFESGRANPTRTIQAAILRREQAAIGADLDAFIEQEEN